MSNAATRADESLYICRADGYTAERCTVALTDAELAQIGWARVEFRTVMLRPPVCLVNGAEGGDEPYAARLPHRPDGQRLRF
jgi:hypothetical protein